MKAPRTNARAGFSLLEALIAVVVLGIVLSSVGLTSRRASDAIDENAHNERLGAELHRALNRALEPLEALELGALPPLDEGTESFTYHVPTGWDGGVQWGPYVLLELEYDPQELDDGIDNDGDGLIDEGQLVRTIAPGTADERRVVLCKGVAEYFQGETPDGLDENDNDLIDERGFTIDVQGSVLTLRLTLESTNTDGRLLRKSAASSLQIRN